MKTINIGIIGIGTVGSATILLLEKNKDLISARAGANIIIKKGVVRDISKTSKDIKIPLSTNIDDILEDEEINIVIELMGGIDTAYEVAKKALKNNKALITANKAMLAYHRLDLQNISDNIGFEASVAGGIPIIKALKDGLSANHILSIRGILNGTCNYILTKMTNENITFEECLKKAQKLGYAEANPSLDIDGFDTAHKLIILSSIAYGINAMPEDILIDGISNISQDDIFFANEFGYKIKLLAIAKRIDNEVELRVHLAMINQNEMISKVSGVMNGISVIGDNVGETMYYGAGAGGNATASAVVGDLIEIIRSKSSPMLGFKKSLESGLVLRDINSIESRYYLRLKVLDKAGTLAKITSTLGENNISIKMLIQKESNDKSYATLLLSTHKSNELNMKKALDSLYKLDVVNNKPFMIRIEE
ncbi:homoserine dehydrogenase [Helicobacter sp. MIT 14-3879]|uniref:homoserine dehydrogenase n=1 Tax=Helicobacter sp. MIT 14-3879 TaxID=2040649 RepID=UPI000E1F1171|nr:homoserine dehydrogenase [Helicobacter sp. MIT 14-3879]RDU63133.1 homoserine dehydrogenase [Helicobacter sp. MIT 14-3879]